MSESFMIHRIITTGRIINKFKTKLSRHHTSDALTEPLQFRCQIPFCIFVYSFITFSIIQKEKIWNMGHSQRSKRFIIRPWHILHHLVTPGTYFGDNFGTINIFIGHEHFLLVTYHNDLVIHNSN